MAAAAAAPHVHNLQVVDAVLLQPLLCGRSRVEEQGMQCSVAECLRPSAELGRSCAERAELGKLPSPTGRPGPAVGSLTDRVLTHVLLAPLVVVEQRDPAALGQPLQADQKTKRANMTQHDTAGLAVLWCNAPTRQPRATAPALLAAHCCAGRCGPPAQHVLQCEHQPGPNPTCSEWSSSASSSHLASEGRRVASCFVVNRSRHTAERLRSTQHRRCLPAQQRQLT